MRALYDNLDGDEELAVGVHHAMESCRNDCGSPEKILAKVERA